MEQIGTKPTKVCRDCNKEKETSNFYKHKNTKDHLRSECIPCWNKKSLDFYNKNKDILKPKRKRYWYERKYDISLEELGQMKDDQQGRCLICKEPAVLVLDHRHSDGKIRGLLCNPCNQGLGSFKENIESLKAAVQYLEKDNDYA